MLPQLRRHFKIYISSSFFSPFTRINCITFSLIWNTYKSQWSFMQSSTMNMNMSWGFIKMKAPKLSPINTWKGWQWLMGKAKLKKSHMADWPFSCRGHQGSKATSPKEMSASLVPEITGNALQKKWEAKRLKSHTKEHHNCSSTYWHLFHCGFSLLKVGPPT